MAKLTQATQLDRFFQVFETFPADERLVTIRQLEAIHATLARIEERTRAGKCPGDSDQAVETKE